MFELIACALTGILEAVLRKAPQASQDTAEVRKALARLTDGDPAGIRQALAGFGRMISSRELSQLREAITGLGPDLELLCVSTPTEAALRTGVSVLACIGLEVERIGAPDMAYNVYESSYLLGVIHGVPALAAAMKLRALSSPAHSEEVCINIWREAIEQLRHSLSIEAQWSEAIDLVELALVARVDSPLLQRQLCSDLMSLLFTALDSPIAGLGIVVPMQAPRAAVDPNVRERAVELLQATRRGPVLGPDELAPGVAAAIFAQMRLDDIRMGLTGVPPVRSSLSWRDLTLTHRQLISAVPLGRALIADVDRTGSFALTLVHEFGHAYCLLGPIGWAFAALFGAIQCAERDPGPQPQRERQLELALRSAILCSVWRPWLEGLSLYLELLCDPAQSPNEILAPFAALRSLLDVDFAWRDGETEEEVVGRVNREWTRQFEGFYTQALNQHSRGHHNSALAVSRNPDRGVYLGGYLLARSLAARWQQTLGRPVTATRVARLLLDATRNGTFAAIPSLAGDVAEFASSALERFQAWLRSLADLDSAALELVLSEGDAGQDARAFCWVDGRPGLIETPGAVQEAARQSVEAYIDAAVTALAGSRPGPGQDAEWRRQRALAAQFAHEQRTLSTLIVVGQDRCRVLLIDEENVVAYCPRTYAGLLARTGDLSLSRYSLRATANVPQADIDALRQACIKQGSARATLTRVVDLVGHADAPVPHPNMSYICVDCGDSEQVLLSWFNLQPIRWTGTAFRKLLRERRRSRAPAESAPEGLGTLPFHLSRDFPPGSVSPAADVARAFDPAHLSHATAAASVGLAFGLSSQSALEALAATLSQPTAAGDLADHLHATGRGFPSPAAIRALATPAGRMAFESSTSPDVRPFGAAQ